MPGMKLKRSREKMRAAGGMSAAGGVVAADGKSVSAAWELLKESAIGGLDAEGLERLSNMRKRAVWLAKKFPERPFDELKVIRFLGLYATGRRYVAAVEEAGLTKLEVTTAFELWPEAKIVFEYVRERNNEARELENEEFIDVARDALMKKLREPGCEIDTKSVLFVLERLERRHFGDPRAKNGMEAEPRKVVGGGVTLNIVADAAKICAEPPKVEDGKPGRAQVYIDV